MKLNRPEDQSRVLSIIPITSFKHEDDGRKIGRMLKRRGVGGAKYVKEAKEGRRGRKRRQRGWVKDQRWGRRKEGGRRRGKGCE